MGENDAKTESSKANGSAEETQAEVDKNKSVTDSNVVAAESGTSADEDQGSGTENEGDSADVDEIVQTLMAEGKRNLVIGEIVQAVQAFQEASALLAAKYGETANECGEAYFKYGTALLELARMETGVLGNALDGVPEEPESDDDTAPEKPAGTNIVENAIKTVGAEKEQIFKDVYSAMDEDSEERKGKKKESGGDAMEGVVNDEGAGCSKAENEDEGETAEDISNFQLAWEMLELARVIFLNEDREKQLQVAHVHLTLGELSMETENYCQSIKDFLKCLALREKNLDPDSRLLAETHYSLGLVYCLDRQFDKSIESYGKSLEVIDLRIANLHQALKEHESGEGEGKDMADGEVAASHKEIKELEGLKPDITAKFEDSKEMKKNDPTKQAILAATGIGAGSSSPFAQSSSSSSAPAKLVQVKSKTESSPKDVSHLMRKRKPEENGDSSDSKKSKSEEPKSNGNAANGHGDTNGDAQKTQIKQKTVEDVLASKECNMETS